jgi:hypothetical protein
MDRWEVTKNNSTYHWDPTVDDSDKVKIITNVYADWKDEMELAIQKQTPFISKQGAADIEQHIPDSAHLYDVYLLDPVAFPVLGAIGERLGFSEYRTHIQTQTTAMNAPLHIDSVNHTDTKRVIVFLQDWYWGQILQFGNTVLHNWKAGDVLSFEFADTPHSTANLSPYSRTIAKITGDATDKFRGLLNE